MRQRTAPPVAMVQWPPGRGAGAQVHPGAPPGRVDQAPLVVSRIALKHVQALQNQAADPIPLAGHGGAATRRQHRVRAQIDQPEAWRRGPPAET